MTETWRASWRAGVAMSTTSVAAVYALMLEFGLNVTSYGTLLMATGLIFGTISALSALSHGVITRAQYSALVAAVVASAVVPTLIANACFLPRHLLKPSVASEPAASTTSSAAAARGEFLIRNILVGSDTSETEAVIAQSRQHYQNALRGVQSKRQVIAYAHCAVTVVRQPTS
jgi:hypothetical protein